MKPFTTAILGAFRAYHIGSVDLFQRYDVEPLRNTFETAMQIEEIRFYAIPSDEVFVSPPNISGYAARDFLNQFAVQFECGLFAFSQLPVDIDLLCTNVQTDLEQQLQSENRAQYQESFRRWRPPQPILIVPGDTLKTRIQAVSGVGLDDGSSLNLWVVFVGKISDEPTPPTYRVPYILQYVQRTPLGPTEPTQVTVPSQNLQNPLNKALRIQRLITRLQTVSTAQNPSAAELSLQGRDILRDYPDFCQISITDDFEYAIADEMDLGALVDPQRSAWTFIRDLDTWGYYKVKFSRNNSIPALSNMAILPAICLMGSREEETR